MTVPLALLVALVVVVSSTTAQNAGNFSKTGVIKSLARQIILQQLYIEERIRTEGDSGLKQTRLGRSGTRTYYGNTWVGSNIASMHNHANNIRTVGLGEFIAVLNGVEFRTRHNDYGLRMPSITSSAYGATTPVPFPEVPKAVLDKPTVAEQIAEMRKWFKAWRDQDYSIRDYRKHFTPVLVFLEGAWTLSKGKIEESFKSDRHFLDAKSWYDMQEKIRYTSYSGRKSGKENFAYLPTALWDVTDDGTPVYAQWNYRILCQPLKDDIPLNRLRLVNDFGARMALRNSVAKHVHSRAARFQINPFNKPWDSSSDGTVQYGFLDKLMGQVPGKDNAMANLTDNAMGDPAYPLDSNIDRPLNVGYYHRRFRSYQKGAMGLRSRHRGYADENMWAAMTTQPKVAPTKYRECKRVNKNEVCTETEQRWSYAIPMEIIYLTPLNAWNPYDIEYKGNKGKLAQRTVYAGGRNGKFEPDKAYNGTTTKLYAITPDDFFSGRELEKDKADTTRSGAYGVLDRKGNVRAVRASGTRITLPKIPGVGVLRTRYPIMPVHVEGNAMWKELDALKDIVMDMEKYSHMLIRPPFSANQVNHTEQGSVTLEVPVTVRDPPGEHTHMFSLSPNQVKQLKGGNLVTVATTIDNGHAHSIQIAWNNRRKVFAIVKCDGQRSCWDGHGATLTVTN